MTLTAEIIKPSSRGEMFRRVLRNGNRFAAKNINAIPVRKSSESCDLRTKKEITDYVTNEVGKVK